MADLDFTRSHSTTELLEEYAFNRLSDVETAVVEEHLLVCPACQTLLAEVDEYILLMKHAASSRKSGDHMPIGTLPALASESSRGARFAWAAAALAACVTFMVAMRPVPADAPPEQVRLVALRGTETEIEKVRPARPLQITLDLTSLRTEESYRAEIVDAAGRLEWNGPLPGSGNIRTFLVARKFSSGQHWVRLYSSDALRREFGLTVE